MQGGLGGAEAGLGAPIGGGGGAGEVQLGVETLFGLAGQGGDQAARWLMQRELRREGFAIQGKLQPGLAGLVEAVEGEAGGQGCGLQGGAAGERQGGGLAQHCCAQFNAGGGDGVDADGQWQWQARQAGGGGAGLAIWQAGQG